MDIQLFITLTLAAIVTIVWAIDIPTTKWEFKHALPRRKKTLLNILEQLRTTNGEEARVEAKPPATTYTEAIKRMQDRETARINSRTSERDPS